MMTERKMNFLQTSAKQKVLLGLSAALTQLIKSTDSETNDLNSEWTEAFDKARYQSTIHNPWFTEESVNEAILGLAHMLRPEAMEKWLTKYDFKEEKTGKRVGMVMAGNIPMVGFHDIFATIIAGHKPVVKPSSLDRFLLPVLFELFDSIVEEIDFSVEWIDGKLPPIDAVIATGSNNTSRYFEYYFKDIPHIIRKNRSSVAILTGEESEEELELMGKDIFSFFGMGCRSISKMYIPEDFEIDRFFKSIYDYHQVVNHNKYGNNYDYYRALWMMNQEDILENGFLILRPCEAIASPTATLFYERYSDVSEVYNTLESKEAEIQCIISKQDIPFGQSQKPELWDYADGVDTMAFLMEV